jgi:tryptophanyl-tRNA synthetase
MAKMDSQLEKMEASLGKRKAIDLEATPEEMESKVVHEEVTDEEAAVRTFRALKNVMRTGI